MKLLYARNSPITGIGDVRWKIWFKHSKDIFEFLDKISMELRKEGKEGTALFLFELEGGNMDQVITVMETQHLVDMIGDVFCEDCSMCIQELMEEAIE